jgi:L-threonylcarbamoyladenylate synthase
MTIVSQEQLIKGAIAGEVVSFPTDTVPALAVLPNNAKKIFTLKQRPLHKPLILMGAKPEDLWQFIQGSDQEKQLWTKIAQKYWPGALTLILPASELVNPSLNPTNPHTIGLRIPNHPIALTILAQTGPMATTSANISGQSAKETLTEIDQEFPEVLTLDYGKPGEKFGSGLPSTVAKWSENKWEILRQGTIKI